MENNTETEEFIIQSKSPDAKVRLAAILELQTDPTILQEELTVLEQLAANDKDKKVREAALETLDLAHVQKTRQERVSKMGQTFRAFIVSEIQKWFQQGLIDEQIATLLTSRYQFGPARKLQKPAPPQPASAAPKVAAIKSQAIDEPAKPRPTLSQTLLSETSVRTFLYLGAFFVISASLILAAIVEVLRLPILLIVTALFAGGALILKKRLPQPSSVLFMVFSALLPINAGVIADSFPMSELGLAFFWWITYLMMTAVWVFATWFYESRLFSIAAFIAFLLSGYQFANIFSAPEELHFLFLSLDTLVALAGVRLLDRWKEGNFSAPLFRAAQLAQVCILFVSFLMIMDNYFFNFEFGESSQLPAWWIATSLTWAVAGIFYTTSQLFKPHAFLPYLSALAFAPVIWLASLAFSATLTAQTIILIISGAIFAIASEVAARIKLNGIAIFSNGLLLSSAALASIGIFFGFYDYFDIENSNLFFFTLLIPALVYGILHFSKPRWWVWSAALVTGLLAYFSFYYTTWMQATEINLIWVWLIPTLALLLPDALIKRELFKNKEWRNPMRALGGFTTSVLAVFFFANMDLPTPQLIASSIMALFFLFYAWRKDARIGYIGLFFMAQATPNLAFILQTNLWLLFWTSLAILWYLIAYLIFNRTSAWHFILKRSTLALGFLTILTDLIISPENLLPFGWLSLLITLLFLAETFLAEAHWAEIASYGIGLYSFSLLLNSYNQLTLPNFSFGATIYLLGVDVLLHKTKTFPRPFSIIAELAGWFSAAVFAALLIFDTSSMTNTIEGLILAVFIAGLAYLWKTPRMAYGATTLLTAVLINVFHLYNIQWVAFGLTGLAVLYFIIGFSSRILYRNAWPPILINSGLMLGTVAAFFAITESHTGLAASLPAAITAVLWTGEAFQRKNVWLGFPSNALYLTAYFILLGRLDVSEPQFYSVGAAALGLLQHYLLVRANSRTAAFFTGMLSQLALLSTTYLQMVATEQLSFFAALFLQSIVVLFYGLIIRSRSLFITPLIFLVLGVMTVVFYFLQGLGTVILIGCTGIVMILAGIVAVLLRERISKIGERLSDWQA